MNFSFKIFKQNGSQIFIDREFEYNFIEIINGLHSIVKRKDKCIVNIREDYIMTIKINDHVERIS